MSKILNYTTVISAKKTILEITGMLQDAGAMQILTTCSSGKVTGLAFQIKTAYGMRGYQLPARVEPCYQVLLEGKKWFVRDTDAKKALIHEQAERVAWRIVKDWLEANLALIKLGMVRLDETMMPYMLVGEDGRTAYEDYCGRQKQLTQGQTQP